MKHNLTLLKLFLLLSVVPSGCILIIDGKWDDNIRLSEREVVFNSTADSVIIKTKGAWWWVTDINISGNDYYANQLVNVEADTYTIEKEDVKIEKRDDNTLFIRAGANPETSTRIITIGLEAGDYFDMITIRQKPKK